MLRGLTTVVHPVADLDAAVAWYSDLLGIEPYFNVQGAYVEFRIGDDEDELGFLNAAFAPHPDSATPSGATAYWHVDDVAAAVEELVRRGATAHDPVTVRNAGFVTASVVDPFGSVLGLMHSPHRLEMAARRG